MKKLYLALLISIPCFAQAQTEKNKRQPDSLSIYHQELDSLWRANRESLQRSEAYITTLENYRRLARKSTDYTSFTVFLDVLGSDYGQFNKMLAQDGFSPLDETALRIGFGTSFKMKRTMVDLYYIVAGLNNKSEKGNEKITTSLSNLLYADIGYNILKNSNWSIYPYGGLSLRLSNIRYTKASTENPEYTSITNMLSGGQEVRLSSTRIGYQLGIGFDIPLWQHKDKGNKTFLFVKAGMNRPLWKDRYQHSDLPAYNAGIKQGIWNVTVGVKLAGRN